MSIDSHIDVAIRSATPADAEDLARIYNPFVANSNVTFEQEPVSGDEMVRRLQEVQAASLPWLVAQVGDEVAGFAFASQWKGRCAYRYSTEVTVYLDPAYSGRGIGSKLYGQLLPALKEAGMHTAMGGIALPNEASVALHEKFGFEKVAHFKEVGFKNDRWIDVGYWQLML